MAELVFRPYRRGDEREIVRVWNESVTKDPINPTRFRNLVLLDANFDPEGLRLAFDGEQLVGGMYAIRRRLPMSGTDLEPDNGWIPWFFVAASHRRQRIGARLMEEALQFLRTQARKTVFFSSYAPNYILPGIDEKAYPAGYQFLRQSGFEIQYSPVAMDFSLLGFEIPEQVKALKAQRQAEGYTFGFAADEDLYELIQFAATEFNADWGRAIREGILQGLPLTQILVSRSPAGKIAGFCMFGGYEGVRERFGPFGVDSSMRGTGLGKILLYDCLQVQRALSLHGSWFLWTGETSPAGYLYQKVGYRVSREFHVMHRSL
jgi:mycothiol synthase